MFRGLFRVLKTSMIEIFTKIVNGFISYRKHSFDVQRKSNDWFPNETKSSTIFVKSSIIDV